MRFRVVVSVGLAYVISCQKENVMFEFESAFNNKIIGMITSGSFAKKFKLLSCGTFCNWIEILVSFFKYTP